MIVILFLDACSLTALYCIARLRKRIRTTNNSLSIQKWNERSMSLWYPLLYIILAMPLSIARLKQILDPKWTHVQLFFVLASIYTCGGWCNVFLYTSTMEGIISWNWLGWIVVIPHSILRTFSPRFFLDPQMQESQYENHEDWIQVILMYLHIFNYYDMSDKNQIIICCFIYCFIKSHLIFVKDIGSL